MAYRLIEHTADVGIEATGRTLEELFRECLGALTDCLTRRRDIEPVDCFEVELAAPDLGQLLVDFLQESIFLYETVGVVFADARVAVRQDRGAWHLTAELVGEVHDPDRHGLGTLIKAVTYHQLRVERHDDGWRARVILDI